MAMFSRSQRLIDGYRNTAYVVRHRGRSVAIRPGCWQSHVDQMLAANGGRNAVFVTAVNPFSRPSGRIVNVRNHRRLVAAFRGRGIPFVPADGMSERGEAEPEHGLLAFRLSRRFAAVLGRARRQNAIITVGTRRPAVVQCLY